MSLTAVPVFLWGRRLMSETWALAAAALTLTIPGFAYSGLLMSETVFCPLVTLAAWAGGDDVRATHAAEPGVRASGRSCSSLLTRLQALVLVPVRPARDWFSSRRRGGDVEPVRRLAPRSGRR